jgi:cell division protein FtsL
VLISAGALVALLMFAVVAFHVVLTQRQFRLDSMQQELSQAQIDHAELTLKVAELESPARIVSVAMHRLHMVNPPRVVYLVPGDHPTAHKVSGVPAPAPAGTPFSTASSAPGR